MTDTFLLAESVRQLRAVPDGGSPAASSLELLCRAWGNPDFQASVEYLDEIRVRAERSRGAVLECGSGITTIVLAVVAERRPVEIVSLEHDARWASAVDAALRETGLAGRVRIDSRPLVEYGRYQWYEVSDAIPSSIGLVVCDGPPGSTVGGRYGLAPLCRDRFTPDVVVLLHDAERDDERRILERWDEEFGLRTVRLVPEPGDKAYAIVETRETV